MKAQKYNIAIFDTFKTRNNKFTGEAKRQRGIIAHLATEQSPELRTRTSIAHIIAERNGILWQNIYSGIFRDLDEVLIPSGVVVAIALKSEVLPAPDCEYTSIMDEIKSQK